MKTNNSIKYWDEEDRPREKLMSKGILSLSNAELIAILIGSGNRDESAVELCKRILKDYNSQLNLLGKSSVQELMVYKGIGEAKAISVVAALELGRRRKKEEVVKKNQITSSKDVFDLFHPVVGDLQHEEFWLITLSRSNKVINQHNIGRGGISGTVADPKVIFNKVILDRASAIILIHNHPSGSLKPSSNDNSLTKKIVGGAKLFDISVLDHLIITDESYFSYADQGMI